MGGIIMKNSGLKAMTTLIFSDSKVRAEFKSNPEKVAARFNLSKSERKSVLTSQTRLGLVSGNSIALSNEIGAFDSWL
jgi:predicted RNA-binding protein (virulence factor B family)